MSTAIYRLFMQTNTTLAYRGSSRTSKSHVKKKLVAFKSSFNIGKHEPQLRERFPNPICHWATIRHFVQIYYDLIGILAVSKLTTRCHLCIISTYIMTQQVFKLHSDRFHFVSIHVLHLVILPFCVTDYIYSKIKISKITNFDNFIKISKITNFDNFTKSCVLDCLMSP